MIKNNSDDKDGRRLSHTKLLPRPDLRDLAVVVVVVAARLAGHEVSLFDGGIFISVRSVIFLDK